MTVFTKQALSGSVNGLPIQLATASSPAQTIHTVQATSTDAWETITLDAIGGGTQARLVSIEIITTGSATEELRMILPARDNFKSLIMPVLRGLPLTGTDTSVLARVEVGSNTMIQGHVNRIATG